MAAKPDSLQLLHELATEHLLCRMRSGEATAAEVTAALKLLKDNGIQALPTPDNALGRLVETLPYLSAEELAEDERFH